MQQRPIIKNKTSLSGFTLVEILLTLALIGMVTLSITNMLLKGSSMSNTMEKRYQVAIEVQAVILDMMQDLAQGAYISNNSHNYRLEYTTYNTSGAATKKVYGICYSTTTVASTDTSCSVNSGSNTIPYLKLSTDGGSTWGSPYRVSPFNKYQFSGTPLFLYAQDANNCTSFVDSDANGVWLSGTDSAGSFLDCGSYDTSSPVLDNPNQASKVVLSGWQFTTGTGNPPVTRTLPSSIFMPVPRGVVVSTAAAVSPAVKDSALVKSFATNTANSLFGASFSAYGIDWDPARERLLVVGRNSQGGSTIYQVDRTGVLIGPPKPLGSGSILPNAIHLLADGQSVIVLDCWTGTVFWYNLNGALPLQPYKTLVLSSPTSSSPSVGGSSALVNNNTGSGLTFDPAYPDEIFVLGQDPADSKYKIFEVSTLTGALATNVIAGGKVALPAAITNAQGLTQEPTTGDFLITNNGISGSAPNRTISIYRITSSGSSSTISINIDDLGSTATGTNGYFFPAYSAELNHFFLSDNHTGMIYEVYPPSIITPRS